MLVVLASAADEAATGLVARWRASVKAGLLTPADLSTAGWRYRVGEGARSTAIVGGRRVGAPDIDGVLVRLPAVAPDELSWFVPDDRVYAAAEMGAFLLAWLRELACPVLNRPTPTGLSGPGRRPECWRREASALGIPTMPAARPTVPPTPTGSAEDPRAEVTVVGRRCLTDTDPILAGRARALADAVGVELLVARFSDRSSAARFVSAGYRPDVGRPEVADALLEYFRGPAGQRSAGAA